MSFQKSPNDTDLENAIVSAYNEKRLIEFIIKQMVDEQNGFREVFIRLVNNESFDLFLLISEFNKPDYDFFLVKQFIEGILPKLTIPPENVVVIVAKLLSMAGQDMSSVFVLEAFENYLQANEQNIDGVLSYSLQNVMTLHILLPSILRSRRQSKESTTNLIKELVSHESEEVRKNAVLALAQIDWSFQRGKWGKWLDWIVSAIEKEQVDEVVAVYVHLLISLAEKYRRGRNELLSIIEKICLEGNQSAIFYVCRLFNHKPELFQTDLMSRLPLMISKLSLESKGSIKELDFGFFNIMQTKDFAQFLGLLESVLLNSTEITMKDLEYTTSELSRRTENLSVVVTRWMSSSSYKINAATVAVIDEIVDKEYVRIVFVPTINVGSDVREKVKLLKKVIGFLFHFPEIVLGYCFSVIDESNKMDYGEIIVKLFDPLAMSFPRTCINYLKKINHPVGNEIMKMIIQEIQPIEGVKVNEFEIETTRRYLGQIAYNSIIQSAFDEARKQSTLFSLIKEKRLLHGTGSIGFSMDNAGNEERYSFKLQKHQFSHEIPRLLIISPITLAFDLYQLKEENKLRILLKEYFESLKERDELDLIIPDLLTLMGMRVFIYPQKGTRQFGVDVAAISTDDEGNETVNLFLIKQKNLTAITWDSDINSVRQSLNEIEDVYIPQQMPAEHKNKPITIYCVFGGNLTDRPNLNYQSYIKEHTTESRKYQTWTSSELAELSQKFIFNERILTSEHSRLIQKALSMVDEPTVALSFFKEFVKLNMQHATSSKEMLPILRSVRLAYLLLVSWANDADNLEIAYLSGEISLLYCWDVIRKLEPSEKEFKEILNIYESIVWYHLTLTDNFIKKTILPYSQKKFAISTLVPTNYYLDVNFRLFDLLGRISLQGLWFLHILNISSEQSKEEIRTRILSLSKVIYQLIENNPALLTPITDDQTIDICLSVLFLKHIFDGTKKLNSWLLSIQNLQYFALSSGNIYTTNRSVYSELLPFHVNPSDFSKENDTLVASTLQAHMLLWAYQLQDSELLTSTEDLIKEFYNECNIQIWLPDENTENSIYTNKEETGITFDQITNTKNFPERLLQILQEKDFQVRFSADDNNFWPLLLVASRHHRIPVNPVFHFVPFLR